jgi:hypothetical protein
LETDGVEVADDVTLSFTQASEAKMPFMSTATRTTKVAFG